MVHPGRADHQYFHGDRDDDCSSRHGFAVGLVCWTSLAAWIPYFERRLCFGPGAYLHARGVATHPYPIRRSWADGIDELLDAIRVVYLVLLSLHNRPLWTHRTSDGA